jgi:hypothetical protein
MKKFFVALSAIAFGVTVGLAVVAGAIYWWVEVRDPPPPNIAAEFDGYYFHEDGSKWGVRVVLANNENRDIQIREPRLIATRKRDGAIAPMISYEFSGLPATLFRGERTILLADLSQSTDKPRSKLSRSDFDSVDEYRVHSLENLAAFEDATAKIGFLFSDARLNLRTHLDVSAWIEEAREGLNEEGSLKDPCPEADPLGLKSENEECVPRPAEGGNPEDPLGIRE